MWAVIFLFVCSLWDLRMKKLPIWLFGVGTIGVIFSYIFCNNRTLLDVVGGIGIGGICLMIGKITNEALGYGDGLLICLIGSYKGFFTTLWVVTSAFVVVGIFSLLFFMGKGGYKEKTIPFVPFLVICYIGVVYI